jgi:transcriptional regulator with XRE-family HTH domain
MDSWSPKANPYVVSKRAVALTGSQARVARGLLGWSQAKLAEVAKVSVGTIRDVEADRAISPTTLKRVRDAFIAARVEFPANGEPPLRA